MKKYVVMQWPEIQYIMNAIGFNENAHLINDEAGINEYGSSAYFVDEAWLREIYKD